MEVLLLIPPLIAIAAIIAVVALARRLNRVSPKSRIVLWIVIVIVSLVPFGIGTCYVMVFSALNASHH